MDLAALLGRADPAALAEAREPLALIRDRGFQRGRNLLAALDAAVDEFRGERWGPGPMTPAEQSPGPCC